MRFAAMTTGTQTSSPLSRAREELLREIGRTWIEPRPPPDLAERLRRAVSEGSGYVDVLLGITYQGDSLDVVASTPALEPSARRFSLDALSGGEIREQRDQLGRLRGIAVPLRAGFAVTGVLFVDPRGDELPRDELSALASVLGATLARAREMSASALHTAALYASPTASFLLDVSGRVVAANVAALRMTGVPREHLAGASLVFHDTSGVDALRAAAEGHVWRGEIRTMRRDGTAHVASGSLRIVPDATRAAGYLVSLGDEARAPSQPSGPPRRHSQPEEFAQLRGREAFLDALADGIARAPRPSSLSATSGPSSALLVIDLDRFRDVNDLHGHALGDRLLQAVAHRLRSALDEGDIIGRIGNDEFAIFRRVLARPEAGSAFAHDILATLSEPFRIEGREITCGACIGLALYPDDAADASELHMAAEHALKRAKLEGRRTLRRFSSDLARRSRTRGEIERDLRRALEQREFLLHYQPQIDIRANRVVGAEALIRWQHPSRGLVAPLDFIPIAEETGLMVPIGIWALREACTQAATWARDGLEGIRMAVNISGAQLDRHDLVSLIERTLRETSLESRLLEVELTESVLMDQGEATVGMLERISALGVQISIDDFGTGYSSLAYLKRFPVDRLKIDRSFVSELTNDQNDAAIARAVISLAHSLDLAVIAEGVETAEQRDYLLNHGCEEVQGFFFSRPVPAAAFVEFVRARAR